MSTRVLAAVIMIALIAGIGIGYLVPRPPPSGELHGEIRLGVLLPLSGDFTSYGARSRVCAELAEMDIAAYIEDAGLPVTFKFYYEDTETNAEVALQKTQALAAQEVKVVIGGLSSSDLESIKDYASDNKLVVLTSLSTVAELGLPDDYIFRLIPHDDMEGRALAKHLYDSGIRQVAILQRRDPCDISIAHRFRDTFQESDGEILAYVEYDPGTSDFSIELAALEAAVAPAIDNYGAETVAIQTLTWEDLALVLREAEERESITLSVRWFGGDAVALNEQLLADAGGLAARTQLTAPLYTAPNSVKKARLVEYVESRLGEEPDIYSLIVYDEMWLAVLSILHAGTTDGEAIRKVVPYTANNYFGASGWTALDETGDRTGLDVVFYQVQQVNSEYEWVDVASYSAHEYLEEALVKEIITSEYAPQAIGPYSQGIRVGNMLFCSGQIPLNPETGEVVNGSIEVQTRQVLENLGAVLKEAGMDYNDVVSVTVFLGDMDDFNRFNQVYAEYFTARPPARCAAEVAQLPKDVDVEISLIAIKTQ